MRMRFKVGTINRRPVNIKKAPRDFLGAFDNVTVRSVGAKLVQRGGDFVECREQLATNRWDNDNNRH
jgi:hypothetical protein